MSKTKNKPGYWPLVLIKFVFFFAIAPTLGFPLHFINKFEYHSDLYDSNSDDMLTYEKEAREVESAGENSEDAESFHAHMDFGPNSSSFNIRITHSSLPSIEHYSHSSITNDNLNLNQGPSPPFC